MSFVRSVHSGPAFGDASSFLADRAIAFARKQVGKKYKWGAEGPDEWDCSGLMTGAWKAAGLPVPRLTTATLAAGLPGLTSKVPLIALKPADMLLFGDPIHHVGMYIGDGKMIEAPYTGATVRIASMGKPVMAVRMIGVGKVAAAAGGVLVPILGIVAAGWFAHRRGWV